MDLAIPVNPARDHVRGNPDGIDIVMYGDFECPYCAQTAPVLQALLARMGDLIMVCYRHFPLIEIHPHSVRAAEAAEAAAAQDAFWPMHDLLYANQHALDDEHLLTYAAELGLDAGRVAADLVSGVHIPHIAEDRASGEASGVTGTPGLFIGGGRHTGSRDVATLEQEVLARLAAQARH
jgi:protein-disulfide isomerase